MQLFRQQAIDYQQRLYGEVLLVPPLRWSVVIGLLLILLAATAAFLTLGSFSRTIAASGISLSNERIELQLPASTVRQLRLGQPVRILPTDTAQRVAPLLHATVEQIIPASSAHPYARVTARLRQTRTGDAILASGTPVEARIVLAPRPLLHWIMTARDMGAAQ